MQRHIDQGGVQISTRMNNYNKIISPSAFVAGASFNTEDNRQLWGNLWSAIPMPNTKAMDDVVYEQHLDLYTKYQNRSLPLHSNFMTAAARNARNDFIITYAAPLFQTDELNFSVTNTEWNQIEFDDLPEGGIPNEPTFTKWGWTDTSKKKKQEVHFSVDLAHDRTYGAQTFIENFAELASNCLLTLYKSTYYSIVHTAYQNKVFDRTKDSPFDVSRLFAAETEAFFAFAVDPDIGFNLIREELRERDNLDLVLLPEGGSRWVKESGFTQRTLPSRQLLYNTASERFEPASDQPGPTTFKSYQLGNNWLDFMETRSFRVNSLDERSENPLSTKLTLCQFYPPNTNIKATDRPKSTDPEILDQWIFYQTKEEGEDRRISFKDALRACGYWNERGEISDVVDSYIDALNKGSASSHHNAPWQFLGQNRSSDVNDDIGDYETPSVAALNAIGNTDDLTRMTSVRDKCVVSQFDTVDRLYKKADYVISYNLDALPHDWVIRVAESLALKLHEKTGEKIIKGLDHLFQLLENMDRAHVTVDYIQGVIDAQMPALLQGGNRPVPVEMNELPEFVLNAYGSLELPSSEVAARNAVIYPNGYQSGPGLLTLRDEMLKPGSPYATAAAEAEKAVSFVEYLITFIRQYVGDTDVISPDLAAPWFQFEKGVTDQKKNKHAAIATFIDAIWRRGVPTFLGVPTEAKYDNVDRNTREAEIGDPVLNPTDTNALLRVLRAGVTEEVFGRDEVTRIRPVITDAIRVLCQLSVKIANDYRIDILQPMNPESEKINAALQAYYQCIMTQANAGRKNKVVSTPTLKALNAITEKFFSLFGRNGVTDEEKAGKALEFIEKITGARTGAKAAQELTGQDAYKEEGPTLAAALEAYEKEMVRRGTLPFTPKTGAERETAKATKAAELNDKRVTYFVGNYDAMAPKRYMRSPFIASDKLRELLRKTGFRWAVPASATSLYTAPDADAARSYRSAGNFIPPEYGAHGRLSGAYEVLLNNQAFGTGFGVPVPSTQRHLLNQFEFAASPEEANQKLVLHQAYPGPVKARMDVYDEIDDPLVKVFYLTVLEAKNTLQTHLKLADVGAQLINVLLFRPFIEFFACSIIVMKAGEDTCATPVSRFDAYISKEDRGYFHAGCSYYSGFVRLNPGNIRMIPYCIPERFVGGKKCDFMTSSDQWVPNNPLKPSIIALPTPVSERTYASPLHMTNGRSITRPDIDYPSFAGKYSSAAFYNHRFDPDNVQHVDEQHYDRIMYKKITYASHVAHKGWQAFKDAASGLLRDSEGIGPGCQRSMNKSGAQYVWNGRVAQFDKDFETRYTRGRAQ